MIEHTHNATFIKPPLKLKAYLYAIGELPPRYPLPSVIGYQQTKYGTYQFDTRERFDGMPLFRGYTWEKWQS